MAAMTRTGGAIARGARRAAAGAAALALAVALAACGAEEPAPEGAAPGEAAGAAAPAAPGERRPAPDFTLPDLEGKTHSLASLRGKTVVIDFWATWCPPCEFQIPVLNKIHEKHASRGVVVLGVSVDVDGKEVVAPYAAQHQVQYTILLGSEEVARDFGAPGFPALIVVDPDGRIHSTHVGLIEEAELEKILTSIAETAAS